MPLTVICSIIMDCKNFLIVNYEIPSIISYSDTFNVKNMHHRVNEISIKPKELGLYALKQNTFFKLCKEVYSPFPLNEKAWEISIKKKKEIQFRVSTIFVIY